MSWCPNCKIEYRDGIEICADCGSMLIKELEISSKEDMIELAQLSKEEDMEKLVDFLNYSHIDEVVTEYISETSTWKIQVSQHLYNEAFKLLKAFYTAEEEKEKKEDKQKEPTKKSSAYVKKADKYEDFKSSATTFLPFGLAGLVFVGLNIFGILTLISSPLQYIVITGMFLGFIYVGVTSWLKLKSIQQEISTEKDNTSEITKWLKENITDEILSSVTDESKGEEVNYIYQTDKMKEMILNEFGNMDENFVDNLVEEYYTQNIDK